MCKRDSRVDCLIVPGETRESVWLFKSSTKTKEIVRLSAGLNIVPSCPDSASFRCVFYPNGHDGESLNLAIGWANNDPPLDFLAMTDPREVAEWLQKRLPFLDIKEDVGRDILSQRRGSLRAVSLWTRGVLWLVDTCAFGKGDDRLRIKGETWKDVGRAPGTSMRAFRSGV